MTDLSIITNNVPRFILDAYELTADERAEFDYIDWAGVDTGSESASFARYRGELYDLGEFERWDNPASPTRDTHWDGMRSDTFFSGVLVRYCDDHESVVMGRYYS
jgi:hypothetical protein